MIELEPLLFAHVSYSLLRVLAHIALHTYTNHVSHVHMYQTRRYMYKDTSKQERVHPIPNRTYMFCLHVRMYIYPWPRFQALPSLISREGPEYEANMSIYLPNKHKPAPLA